MEILEITRKGAYSQVVTLEAVYEIDNGRLKELHLDVGADADPALLSGLHDACRLRRARARANYLLDERAYSYAMLYRKLMETYRDKALVTQVLDELTETGQIDDTRYAYACAEYLVERKRWGRFRAKQEMLHRGLPSALVEDALAELAEAEAENLPLVLERKYGRLLTDPDDRKAIDKAIAGMARLGYPFREVRYAIEDWFASLEEEDEDD